MGRRQGVSGGRSKLWLGPGEGLPRRRLLSACMNAAGGRTFQEANTRAAGAGGGGGPTQEEGDSPRAAELMGPEGLCKDPGFPEGPLLRPQAPEALWDSSWSGVPLAVMERIVCRQRGRRGPAGGR